ncbi:HNH endonuclease [Priestia sp. LL-8]|uniref:HNH endonuclease n=1 Tax=Priestia sp. LL-8 TaxID=3110068 RepID=UPI002E26056D|nr:HNH endonuclease [Priestia sp. LL-8]
MWNINSSNSQYIYRFTDEFICDVLSWACTNKGIKSIPIVRKTNLNAKLKSLVEYRYFWKLREHMYKLTTCKKINEVRIAYLYFSNHYIKIIKGDIVNYPILDNNTINHITPIFRYFYDNLLDNEYFWNVYNPSHKYMTKLELRGIDTAHKTCPYCDRNHIVPSSANNIDHLLPQSDFPFLSIYWRNLVISCSNCNSKNVKGNDWYLPILHPCYDKVEDILYFSFDKSKQQIIISVRNNTPSEISNQKKGDNFIKALKLNKSYEKMWFLLKNERRAMFECISEAIDNSSGKTNVIIPIEKGIERREAEHIQEKQTETYTKLKLDYCLYAKTQTHEVLAEWLNEEYK